MLTLGWSDGFSFAPLNFVMLSSAKLANRFREMASHLSKRSHGYKRRIESFSRKPDAVAGLLDRDFKAGFTADYVLTAGLRKLHCFAVSQAEVCR